MNAKLKSLHGIGRWSGGLSTIALALPIFLASTSWSQVPGTVVTFPWDWHISASPNMAGPAGQEPGDPIPIWLWGTATAVFGEPREVSGNTAVPQTFDLGPGGTGFDILTAEPPPIGGVYEIDVELCSWSCTRWARLCNSPVALRK